MSVVLLNMCVLKKEDIDKFHKVFNIISNTLEKIYSDVKKLKGSMDSVSRSLGSSNFTNGNPSSRTNSSSFFGINDLVKIGLKHTMSKSFGIENLSTNIRRLNLALMALNLAGYLTRKRDQESYAPVDSLAKEVNQPYKKIDALVNTFKVKANVDIERVAGLLINLKNNAAVEGTEGYEALKDLDISIYDEHGNMKDIVAVLSTLANRLENMSDQKASEVQLALGIDSNILHFLRQGQGSFDVAYKEQEKWARDESPYGSLTEESNEIDAKVKLANRKIVDELLRFPTWLGAVWTSGINNIKKNYANYFLNNEEVVAEQMKAFGPPGMYLNQKKAKDNILKKATNTLNNIQNDSQLLLNEGNTSAIYNNQRVSYQNTFNMPPGNSEEVARIVDEKMRAINQDVIEQYDDGELV